MQKQMMMMLKSLSVCVFIVALPYASAAQNESQNKDHISVVGVAEVEQEPDQAILNISITATKPSLADAKADADQRYSKVLKVIANADIDKKQIKSTRFNAQPLYNWVKSKQVYKGEKVSRSLSITINDLKKVSPLMQALITNGVSTIDNLNSAFKDPKSLQQKALLAAADDARTKAKFLAERLGRKLGSAYLINESNTNAPQVLFSHQPMMKTAALNKVMPAPDEMFGQKKVRAQVNVSFNLL